MKQLSISEIINTGNSADAKIEKVNSFLKSFEQEYWQAEQFTSEQKLVWTKLIEAGFQNESIEHKRDPSISFDGTPFVSSLNLNNNEPSLRALVEPGGTGITLAQQIDYALQSLGDLYRQIGWSETADDVNWFSRSIFPNSPSELENWWGGIWLGAALQMNGKFEIRVYFNLRNGSIADRWQRLSKLLSRYIPGKKDGRFWEGFAELSIRSTAVPVGIGLVLQKDKLKGIRIYQGLEKADSAKVAHFIQNSFESQLLKKGILNPLQELENNFGSAPPQSFTISHDFIVYDNIITNNVYRAKCDINCKSFVSLNLDQFENWMLGTLDANQQKKLKAFANLLNKEFGGAELDYFSLGISSDSNIHRTLYVKPLNLSPFD